MSHLKVTHLKVPLVLALLVLVSACDVVNEKVEIADDAANRMVGKLDNSKVNQTINNSLDSVGDKATGFMPEAIRPPAERLRTDDSPVLGVSPDPEMATPVNSLVSDDGVAESTSAGTAVPEVAVTQPNGPDTVAAERPNSSGAQTIVESETGVAPPPVALAADNSAEKMAEKELARAAQEEASKQTFGLVELSAAGVTLKRVNIRLGPGTEHEKLDTIEAGTPLRVAGRTNNDWLLIERDGKPFGFILASLVRTDE